MAITTVLIALLMLGIGIGLGVAIGRSMYSTEDHSEALQQEMDQLKKEYDDYRNSVNQHFATTSDLVNELTNSYRKVYQHLATGAQTLCLPAGKAPDLELPQTPLYEAENDNRGKDEDSSTQAQEATSDAQADTAQTHDDEAAEKSPAQAQENTQDSDTSQPTTAEPQASETAQATGDAGQTTEDTPPDTASTGKEATTETENETKPKSEAA